MSISSWLICCCVFGGGGLFIAFWIKFNGFAAVLAALTRCACALAVAELIKFVGFAKSNFSVNSDIAGSIGRFLTTSKMLELVCSGCGEDEYTRFSTRCFASSPCFRLRTSSKVAISSPPILNYFRYIVLRFLWRVGLNIIPTVSVLLNRFIHIARAPIIRR
ncbi:hypothetical protein D3C74_266890 [compost metagenome]